MGGDGDDGGGWREGSWPVQFAGWPPFAPPMYHSAKRGGSPGTSVTCSVRAGWVGVEAVTRDHHHLRVVAPHGQGRVLLHERLSSIRVCSRHTAAPATPLGKDRSGSPRSRVRPACWSPSRRGSTPGGGAGVQHEGPTHAPPAPSPRVGHPPPHVGAAILHSNSSGEAWGGRPDASCL